jgi:hypothetical protein
MSAVTRSAGFMSANADQPNAEIVLRGRPLTQITVGGAFLLVAGLLRAVQLRRQGRLRFYATNTFDRCRG